MWKEWNLRPRIEIVMVKRVHLAVIVIALTQTLEVFAQDGPCAAPEPFNGYWGGGQIQLREAVAGVPIVATARFSYRQIRYSPCTEGIAVFPPGVGEASITLGIPVIDNRRGGWLLQMAAHGQGSQKPNEPASGVVTGAPAMAGHLNLWETPLPLIQLTGAASAIITPQFRDVPLSIAYLGGVRTYLHYTKHAQANLGMMIGGRDDVVDIVPSSTFRISDLSILNHKMAIGLELRAPITFSGGPLPVRWRLWGALTLALEKLNQSKSDRPQATQTRPGSYDLVRSPPEAAPPAQTAWELTL
jgi:hypothetical protein